MAHYTTPMHRRFGAVTPTTGYEYGGALGQGTQMELFEERFIAPAAPSKPRKQRKKRKPGRAAKCKVVTYKNGTRRRLCWDKHGVLTSNRKPGTKGGKKTKCKTKCPKGTRKVCTGGFHAKKGSKKRVCRKYTCKRK